MTDQRANIKSLLVPEYWQAEADEILDDALEFGWTLDQIAYAITQYGVEALITTLFTIRVGTPEMMSLKGPDNAPGAIPLIVWGAIYF